MARDPEALTPERALSDSDQGVRGSTWLLLGRVFGLALGLTTQVVLVRSLTQGDYGFWALALALVIGLRILVSLGHGRVIARFFAIYREHADAARLRGTVAMEMMLIVGLGSCALATAAVALALQDDDVQGDYLPVLVLLALAPLEALEEVLESLFAAFGRVRTIIVRQHLLIPGLRLAAVVALAASGAPLLAVAAGYLGVSVVSLGYYGWMARHLMRTEEMFLSGSRGRVYPVREVFSFSVPMLSGELVYIVNGTLNVVLLGAVRGPVPVGGLRAIMPFADANLLVRRQFYRLFLPLAAAFHDRSDSVGLAGAYWRTASWVAVLTFPLFAVTGPFAPILTTTLLGEEYAESAGYLALLAGAFYLNAAIGFNAELLHAAARLRFVTWVNLATAAVSGAVAVAFVPSHGAWAVAWAAASSVLVQNLLNQVGVRQELRTFLPPAPYRRPYVLIGLGTLTLFGVQRSLEPSLLVAVAMSAVVSLFVLALSAPALRPGEAFPELLRLRVPGVGRRPPR